MGKKRMIYFAAGFGALILAVIFLLVQGGARRSGEIVLAPTAADGTSETGAGEGDDGPRRVRLTPETVQLAINTLSRPTTYSRSQTVETFWSGGRGESLSTVAVSGARTRVDTKLPVGTRHILTLGGTAAVWYDDETDWTVRTAEEFTADKAARMPTYEEILSLPVTDILQADYQDREGVGCIYVATEETEDGYADRYWVSVSTGLLEAAERTWNGELVYRFTASSLDPDPPEDSLFLLPDGSVLE